MAYSEVVRDHFKNPRNVGEMKDADGVGEVGNPICGDMMSIFIKVADDRINDISFLTFGCGEQGGIHESLAFSSHILHNHGVCFSLE